MLDIARTRIAAGMRWLIPARRFVRRQDGAAAVEFALVAVPFLALTFAIIETALIFFAGQSLEAAAASAGRLILTGQAQTDVSPTTGTAGFTQEDFKKLICNPDDSGSSYAGSMFDCSKVYVSVKSYDSFSAADTSTPLKDGKMTVDVNSLPFDPGNPGSIVVVQIYYAWPIAVSLLNNLGNLNGGDRLLVATSVFRNEPYK
jgi:Flp pilus assembly protein TadG